MNKVKFKVIIFAMILMCNLNLFTCCFARKKREAIGKISESQSILIQQLFINMQNDNLTGMFFILVDNPAIVNSIFVDEVTLQNGEVVSGVTALTYAIMRQNIDMVSSLITFKVDINLKDGNRNNPLSLARSKGNQKIVRILTASGAEE